MQRLKLAQVASKIVKAYRKGDIALATVMALTLADSRKRQWKFWLPKGFDSEL